MFGAPVQATRQGVVSQHAPKAFCIVETELIVFFLNYLHQPVPKEETPQACMEQARPCKHTL